MTWQKEIHNWFLALLTDAGMELQWALHLNVIVLGVAALISIWLVAVVSRQIILRTFTRFAKRTRTLFDDFLIKNKAIRIFVHGAALILIYLLIPVIFYHFTQYIEPANTFIHLCLIVWGILLIRAILHSLRDYLKTKDSYRDKPIDSFVQIVLVAVYLVAVISAFSIVTGQSALVFITAMGAASAVVLLIFRDTILGFVASIQVAVNDMVRIGDWITMEKYGADGDVVEINLITVKIQNFDKTITTIPTYFLISDSFKNWRGMLEAGGRRIKRSVKIKVSSIRYLTDEDLERFKKIELIREYLIETKAKVESHNEAFAVDTSLQINGQQFTNIGVYRKYIDAYIQANEHLHPGMTMMARQLEPTVQGIPIELYVFTADVRWENYEHIMADLFDHLLAAVPFFDLEVFEMPNSGDIQQLGKNLGKPGFIA